MGLVLAFETAPRRSSARPAAKRAEPAKTTADILFFTGVRYERHDDAGGRQPSDPRPDQAPPVS